jgi:AraC-like DNA-binding protein
MIENFIFLIVGILGIITTSIISQHKSNRAINIYLILIFTIISLRFLFQIFIEYFHYLIPPYSFTPFLSLALPIMYLYFTSLVNDSKKIKKRDLRHFIFPISLGLVNIMNNKSNLLGIHSELLLTSVFILFSLYYTSKIFIVLKNFVWNRSSKIIIINKQNELIRNWTYFLFAIILLGMSRLIISIIIDFIRDDYSGGKNQLWLSGILCIILFIKVLSTPEILFGYNALYKKINVQEESNFKLKEIWIVSEKKEIINQQDYLLKDKILTSLSHYIKDIEYLAVEEKVFRNQKITLAEIAKKLDIPKSHLHFIFKYHSKISFTDFKKLIKIHDALQLIESGYLKLNTLEALALKIGFSSYNPFFTSFKEITGSTPQAYNKELIANKSK